MSKKEKNLVDHIQLITQCGKLGRSFEQTGSLVSHFFPEFPPEYIISRLQNSQTEEYKAYACGKTINEFEIDNAIYSKAADGDGDSLELFHRLQNEKVIDDTMKDKFFPDQDDTECR